MASSTEPIVVGVDPATGVSSPMAVAVFYPETKAYIHHCEMSPPIAMRREDQRLGYLAEEVGQLLISIDKAFPRAPIYLYIESFVMYGKSGAMLQRLIGCVMSKVPARFHFAEVQNLTVKKLVAGTGRAEKLAVGQAVVQYFNGKPEIAELVTKKRFDATDAYAIGIAGWLRETAGKRPKKSKRAHGR